MIDKDALLTSLRTGVTTVIFTKADGSTRVMEATLKPELINYQFSEDELSESHGDSITVWDTYIQEWRRFNVDRVIDWYV